MYHYFFNTFRLNRGFSTLTEYANENLQKNLTVYLFTNSGLEEEKIINLLQSLPLLLKDKVMNTLEIFEKKGFDIRSEINLKNE